MKRLAWIFALLLLIGGKAFGTTEGRGSRRERDDHQFKRGDGGKRNAYARPSRRDDRRRGFPASSRQARLSHPRDRQVRPAGFPDCRRTFQSVQQEARTQESGRASCRRSAEPGGRTGRQRENRGDSRRADAWERGPCRPFQLHRDERGDSRGPDDEMSDPAGNSGTRIACGVIKPSGAAALPMKPMHY